ncbi:LexA family protein [Plesiomonas shigelloides]|uniref:LexA family protein n=2 Tax=Plesiomonas shigelloides TaxID=703 RepID=UPI0027411979|nr:S24 family peptidase [Plesiomonas shigelloides]
MENMTLADRLISRRQELNMTQETLAAKSGVTRMGISKIELGLTIHARADTLFSLAKALKCNAEWLLYGKGEKEATVDHSLANVTLGPTVEFYVPEINWVQAGAWTAVPESVHPADATMHPCPVKCSPSTFALRVRGDSMLPRFEQDDLIFVDPTKLDPTSGKFVVAMLEGSSEATFKQYQELDGKRMLKALNPDYPPEMRYVKMNGNCRIIGTVVSHVKPV